jgi:MFS family permease
LSLSEASQLIMYGLFGAMIGGPFIGWVTSRLNSTKTIYTLIHNIVLIGWIVLFLSGLKPPFFVVVVLLFVIGFGSGASSLTFAVVRESFPMKEVGVVTGFANMGGFLSAVLLQIVFGYILDLFPQHSINIGYHYGFTIPILFSLMGLIGVMIIKEEKANKTVLSSTS